MGKRKEIMKFLKDNPRMIRNTIKVYNKMCLECKKQLFIYRARNMDLPYNKMCEKCKEIAKEELGYD